MTDTKLITLTVSVGLLLVIGGYTLVSLPHAPEEPETVKIGVMSPTTETYDRYVFLGDAALNAINSYCEETRQRYRFDFVYTDAMSHPGIVIENIQNYHNQSIDLLIGCGWSSQLCSAITYLNIHNMTLISPTSTNPQKCTRLDDGVFKMSPIDTRYGLPVARAVESLNVDRVVVMYKGDLWGEFLLESFKQAYHGEVSEIRYAAELGEGMVTEYVQAADDLIGGSSFGLSGSAVLLISTDEAVDIVKEASNYPRLMNATWFSVEEVTISEPSEEEISEVSTIKLLSPLPSLPESDALTVLENNYSDAFGEPLNYPKPTFMTPAG